MDAAHLARIRTQVVVVDINRRLEGRRQCEGGIVLQKFFKNEPREGSIPYRIILVI